MISYEEAIKLVLENTAPIEPPVELPLNQLLGRYLAEPIIARIELPTFDNSAVDGFGVKVADLAGATPDRPIKLKLTGEIQAGSNAELEIKAGETVKILTGARVPSSVEAVVMKEFCHEASDTGTVTVSQEAKKEENIRRRGGEFAQGASVFPAGARITPPVIGLIASLGYNKFKVHDLPRAAIVVTGDELVEPGKHLELGQIYDSNSYALQAALTSLGLKEPPIMHSVDTREATKNAFKRALESADVIVSSGGVSVGDHDHVKEILEELGVRNVFWQVAIKPGKPIYFGILEVSSGAQTPTSPNYRPVRKLIFGLPGNPVSVLVTFHQFVKPALLKMMGKTKSNPSQWAINSKQMKKKPGRLDFVRGTLAVNESGEKTVRATVGQDSHMLSGLATADHLIHFARQAELLAVGELVEIDHLSWTE